MAPDGGVPWGDTQIVATVAPAALTGNARVRKNGVWSNAKAFTVTGPAATAREVVRLQDHGCTAGRGTPDRDTVSS